MGPGGHQGKHETAVCCVRKRIISRLREISLCTGEATSPVLCPLLDSSVQERYGLTGTDPAKNHKSYYEILHVRRL